MAAKCQKSQSIVFNVKCSQSKRDFYLHFKGLALSYNSIVKNWGLYCCCYSRHLDVSARSRVLRDTGNSWGWSRAQRKPESLSGGCSATSVRWDESRSEYSIELVQTGLVSTWRKPEQLVLQCNEWPWIPTHQDQTCQERLGGIKWTSPSGLIHFDCRKVLHIRIVVCDFGSGDFWKESVFS